MSYESVASRFSCQLPKYFEDLFPSFIQQYQRDDNLLPDEALTTVVEATGVPKECGDMVRCVRDAILQNDCLHKAAAFYLYVTVYSRLPWENYLYTEDLLTIDGFVPNSVNLFFVSCALANTLLVKKPPQDLNEENLGAYRGYSRQCYEQKGIWGINEFNWNMLCAGGCMFMQGALKFCPSFFTGDFPVLTDGHEYVSLLQGEFKVNKFGELVDDGAAFVTQTVYEETDQTIKAHRISKAGTVSLEPEVFDRSVWKDFLRGGTATLDIHIPSHMDYRPEVLADAYQKALRFYSQFYPTHHVKAVAGYSWIFSPQLRLILSPDSNILQVQNTMHVLPTTGTYDQDNRFVRPGSSMQEKIRKKIEEGRAFHYACMYIPVSEIK